MRRLLLHLAIALVSAVVCFAAQEPSGAPENKSPVSPKSSAMLTKVMAQENNGGITVVVEATGDIQYTAFKLQNPLRLVLDIPKMQKGVLGDNPPIKMGMVESIRPIYFDQVDVLRLEIALSQPTSYEVIRVDSNKLAINLREPVKETARTITPAPVTSPKPTAIPVEVKTPETFKPIAFTDEACQNLLGGVKDPISIDFQKAQVSNIFRILAEIGGFNVILAPAVQGTVNVRLVDTPWNHALEIILKNNGLEKQCFGNVIRVVPQEVLTNEEVSRSKSKTAKTAANLAESLSGELVTEVIGIDYSDSKELLKSLEALKSKDRGKVTLDTRTNTFVLTDVRDNVDAMLKVIKSLDHPTRQVIIEARIVEVSRDAARDLGVQWGAQGAAVTSKNFPSTIQFGSSKSSNPGFITDLAPTVAAAGTASGIGLSLGSLTKDFVLDIQLSAIETAGRGKILSAPKVTTLDNKEAKIQSGSKIPYATVSQSGTQVQFIDANIELTVTPHITEDQNVLMKIEAKKNAVSATQVQIAGGGSIPGIDTKEAHTEVLVHNGETTVLGGLYENNAQEHDKRVPGLANIPGLGYLFKSFTDTETVRELLIFITPTVVKNF